MRIAAQPSKLIRCLGETTPGLWWPSFASFCVPRLPRAPCCSSFCFVGSMFLCFLVLSSSASRAKHSLVSVRFLLVSRNAAVLRTRSAPLTCAYRVLVAPARGRRRFPPYGVGRDVSCGKTHVQYTYVNVSFCLSSRAGRLQTDKQHLSSSSNQVCPCGPCLSRLAGTRDFVVCPNGRPPRKSTVRHGAFHGTRMRLGCRAQYQSASSSTGSAYRYLRSTLYVVLRRTFVRRMYRVVCRIHRSVVLVRREEEPGLPSSCSRCRTVEGRKRQPSACIWQRSAFPSSGPFLLQKRADAPKAAACAIHICTIIRRTTSPTRDTRNALCATAEQNMLCLWANADPNAMEAS